jgi:formylglycine-generating enzyme required for sulfatase activity
MSPTSWSRTAALCLLPLALAGLLSAPPAAASDLSEDSDVDLTLQARSENFTNSVGMKLVLVKAGKFKMGSPKDEKTAENHEWPQHEVEISKDFFIGSTEVTQKQYKAITGNNPSRFNKDLKDGPVGNLATDDFPVDCVSYDDVEQFLKKLNAKAEEKRFSVTYRLPTEAEWEYACRGGPSASNEPFHFKKPTSSLSFGQANFQSNNPFGDGKKGASLGRPTVVASYEPNALGVYDMHGNLWEWVQDWYDANYYSKSPRKDPTGPQNGTNRVIRGGGWYSDGYRCRAAFRNSYSYSGLADSLGFRVVAVPRGG